MNIKHPFDFIPVLSRKRLFLVFITWTLFLFAVIPASRHYAASQPAFADGGCTCRYRFL